MVTWRDHGGLERRQKSGRILYQVLCAQSMEAKSNRRKSVAVQPHKRGIGMYPKWKDLMLVLRRRIVEPCHGKRLRIRWGW